MKIGLVGLTKLTQFGLIALLISACDPASKIDDGHNPLSDIVNISITSVTDGDSKVDLTWSSAGDGPLYRVKYGTISGSYPTTVAACDGISSKSCSITSLTNGTNYYFIVEVIKYGFVVQTTAEVSGLPFNASVTPPSAPGGVSATAGSGVIDVSWSASAGASTYTVYRSTTSGSGFSALAACTTQAGLSCNDTTTSNGTTYYYIVRSTNAGGNSSASSEVSGRPISSFSISSVAVNNTAGPSALEVTWGAAAGASTYDISWGTGGSPTGTGSATGVTSPYTVTGLTAGTAYTFRVVAKNAVGSGNFLNSSNVSGTPMTRPSISSVTQPGANQAAVTWTGGTGSSSFAVKYGTVSGTYGTTFSSSATSPTTVTGLSNGTKYFMVTATNSSGSLDAAVESSLTVFGPATQLIFSSGPASVTAGNSSSITVTAKDAAGSTVTDYSGTVTITSNDGAATLPASSTLTSGTKSFSFTLKTAGSKTVSAGDGTLTATSSGITVNPAAYSVAQSTLGVSASSVASGSAITVTLTAKDAYGNSNPSGIAAGTSDIVFSSSLVGGTGSYSGLTAVGSGVYTASFTGAVAGSVTLSVSIASNTVTATQSVTVTFGPASDFVVSDFPSPTLEGEAHNVSVTAKDAAGNTVTNFAGAVVITSSDGSATLPASSTLTSGTKNFSVTLNTPGTRSITATSGGITGAQTGIVVEPKLSISGFGGFPEMPAGADATTYDLTITNSGAYNATGLSVDVTGDSQISISANTCASGGTAAAAGASCTITLRLSAGSPITIASDLSYTNSFNADLNWNYTKLATAVTGPTVSTSGDVAPYESGFGTDPAGGGTPYEIKTELQLRVLANFTSNYFVQSADIDLKGFDGSWSPDPAQAWIMPTMKHIHYDGGGRKISNFFIDGTGQKDVSFFGYLNDPSEIHDLTFENFQLIADSSSGLISGTQSMALTLTNVHATAPNVGLIDCAAECGGLIGVFNGGGQLTIDQSSFAGTVGNSGAKGKNGGLVGYDGNRDSSMPLTITNSTTSGLVRGDERIGGLIGHVEGDSPVIDRSSSSSTIAEVNGSGHFFAGIIGELDSQNSGNTQLTNTSFTGNITWTGGQYKSLTGGLIGHVINSALTIDACTTSGIHHGGTWVGGMIGLMESSKVDISSSSSTATVQGEGSIIGGLVGYMASSQLTISKSYMTGSVTGYDVVGGLVGYGQENLFIDTSWTAGTVGSYTSNDYIGGLIGIQKGAAVVSKVYSRATVLGTQYVGGIAGGAVRLELSDSYFAGVMGAVKSAAGLVAQDVGANTIATSLSSASLEPTYIGTANFYAVTDSPGSSFYDRVFYLRDPNLITQGGIQKIFELSLGQFTDLNNYVGYLSIGDPTSAFPWTRITSGPNAVQGPGLVWQCGVDSNGDPTVGVAGPDGFTCGNL